MAGGSKAPCLWPRAETPTHFITLGFNEDLDLAMKQALRQMLDLICAGTDLTRVQAYQFCSLAADFRVTQTVNGEKGGAWDAGEGGVGGALTAAKGRWSAGSR